MYDTTRRDKQERPVGDVDERKRDLGRSARHDVGLASRALLITTAAAIGGIITAAGQYVVAHWLT